MLYKLFYTCFIFFLLLFCCDDSHTKNQFAYTKGKQILTPDGKPFIIRGINLGNWLVPEGYMFKFQKATSPRLINEVLSEIIGPAATRQFWKEYHENYVTRDDILFLKKIGINTVRVPFNYRLFTPEEYPEIWIDTGFKILDRLVGWCREADIRIILDMHCAPGGQTGDNIDDSWGWPWLFESEESQNRTAEVWQKIAQRYSQESIILGYDLLNEPVPHWDEVQKYNGEVEPLYRKITQAIRAVDQNHILFIGGSRWNTRFDIFGTPFDSNLVYTFHKYWDTVSQASIQPFLDFREKFDIPIWLGESGENSNGWIDSCTVLMEKNGIGWTYWPYKKMESTSCLVTFEKPEFYDDIIQYAENRGNTFTDRRKLLPRAERVRSALKSFLINCRFENCRSNSGYIQALHLNPN
jgi:endoglucanase